MSVIRELELELLTTWCDTLCHLQLTHESPRFDGGILCPSCLHLHGRIIDLVYPLCYLSDVSGDRTYVEHAKRIVAWGENLYCDDHSYYNDAQQSWNKTTIFFAQSLMQALAYHGHILDAKTKAAWEHRLREISEWMMHSFAVNDPANTNYHASCCGALAMCATYFQEPAYMEKAKKLKEFCEQFISEDQLFFGEGNPRAFHTNKGCVSIDIGYSLEESLPGLLEYAHYAKDDAFKKQIANIMKHYLDFMLPDGGIDNSFGTRNFKWTYWGSRTSDGCCKALSMLAEEDPVFMEACYRNVTQLQACTKDGYLYGGPHYAMHQEEPCIHHMFAHAKAIAGCLDMKEPLYQPCKLPLESDKTTYYPSLDTYRIHCGSLQATITGFDYSHIEGGHVSGGLLSLLYHEAYGPVIACGITDVTAREPLNTQLSLQKESTCSSTWRICYEKEGVWYANSYDLCAIIKENQASYHVDFTFSTIQHRHDTQYGEVTYDFKEQELLWTVRLHTTQHSKLMLPIVAGSMVKLEQKEKQLIFKKEKTTMILDSSHVIENVRDTFSLVPGFCCKEVTIALEAGASFTLHWRFI